MKALRATRIVFVFLAVCVAIVALVAPAGVSVRAINERRAAPNIRVAPPAPVFNDKDRVAELAQRRFPGFALPDESPAFVNRMQRVDNDIDARQRNAKIDHARAKSFKRVRLGSAGETGLRNPCAQFCKLRLRHRGNLYHGGLRRSLCVCAHAGVGMEIYHEVIDELTLARIHEN